MPITFDKIRELERNEKSTQKLQPLPETLMNDISDYIKTKEKINEKTNSDLLEIENAKSAVRRLLETRERKILEMALMSIRANVIPENLTDIEKKLFNNIENNLKDFRKDFFAELEKEHIVKKDIIEKEISKENIYLVEKDMQDFTGPDMKTYSLKKGENIKLPDEVSEILLSQGIIKKL